MPLDELERISREGAALDAGAAAPGEGAAQALDAVAPAGSSDADMARSWAAVPMMFGAILGQFMPELKPVYSDSACQRWGEHMVPVAKKRGWNDAESLPELALVMVSLPFIVNTALAVKARRQSPAKGADASVREQKSAEVPTGMGSVNAGVV